MKHLRYLPYLLTFSILYFAAALRGYGCPPVQAGQASDKRPTATMSCDQGHHEMVNQRGDHVMGFDHTKTTHHFRLLADGGVIEVSANDPKDLASRDQIRSHLQHIAKMFAEGDFSAPMLIHGQTPPGVEEMKVLENEIKYKYEETSRGACVRISTQYTEALTAVHDFLRFQIKDHQTGDSLDVERK